MLISVLSSSQDRGVYAFVVNYGSFKFFIECNNNSNNNNNSKIGSLIVRILFQPLEETGRTFFSKLLQDSNKQARYQAAANVLTILIQFHLLLGLVFVCFATNYASTLVDLLAGKGWSLGEGNAPGVLSVYCIYVPFMGINGITEGFVQAVATKSDLSRLSWFMVLFSVCFMVSGFVFMDLLELGATGLILANMVNLGIRICYSWYYISKYFGKHVTVSVRQWCPHAATLAAFALAWVVTFWSNHKIGWYTLQQKMVHISIGGICFIFCTFIM